MHGSHIGFAVRESSVVRCTVGDIKLCRAAVYRLSALRRLCGFRTIPKETALVITSRIPVDILAGELRRIYVRKQRRAEKGKWNPIG